jgi:hypothetical protein
LSGKMDLGEMRLKRFGTIKEKPLNVVFKYLSRGLLYQGVGGGRSNASRPHHHPISQMIHKYFI